MVSLCGKMKVKRILATLLLVCTVATTFITSLFSVNIMNVEADSNDLRSLYMQLAAGKDFIQLEDINKITTDDLRVLALFLSNFYKPWDTQLDESEESDKNKEVMVGVLTSLGYKKDSAEQIIDVVFKATLESAQKIYVDDGLWGYDYQDATTLVMPGPVVNATTTSNANYQSFVGGKDEHGRTPATIFQWTIGSTNCDPSPAKAGNKFYYGDKVVWEWNNMTRDLYISFLMKDGESNLETQQVQRGYWGNAFSQIQMISGKVDALDMTDDERGKTVIFTQNMYVDWVGNILADLGSKRVIVIPAACNPFVFSKIGASDDTTAYYNMISLRGLRLLNFRGERTSSGYKLTKLPTKDDANRYKLYLVWAMGHIDKANTWDSDRRWFRVSAGYAGDWMKWLNGDAYTENKSSLSGGIGVVANTIPGDGNVAFYFGDAVKRYYVATVNFSDYSLSRSNSLGQLVFYDSAGLADYKKLDEDENVFDTIDFFASESDVCNEYFNNTMSGYSSMNIGDTFTQSMLSFNGADKQILASIYLTYVFAYNNTGKDSYVKSTDYCDMQFNDIFPQYQSSEVQWDTTKAVDNQIKSFIYYLLHPSEGIAYVSTLFKAKVGGIFISWHEDIVGSENSNTSTGSTRYLGMTGYATSPSLNDVEWVARWLTFYNSIIVYIIIFMSLVMLCYLMVGSLSLQRAILGFLMFSICAFIPPVAITAVVDMINMSCDRVYSNKFEFWAVCQTQQYLGQLESLQNVAQSNSFDYYSELIQMNSGDSYALGSAAGFGGVKLKWMSPKKFNELSTMNNELQTALSSGYANYGNTISMVTSMISATTSSETYIDTANATYLYRDFLDIYRYAMSSYNLYTTYNFQGAINGVKRLANKTPTTADNSTTEGWGSSVTSNIMAFGTKYPLNTVYMTNNRKYLSNMGILGNIDESLLDTSSLTAIKRGFLFNTITPGSDASKEINTNDNDNAGFNENSYNYNSESTLALSLFTGSNYELKRIHKNYERLSDYVSGTKTLNITADNLTSGIGTANSIVFGLPHSDFEFSLQDFVKLDNKGLPSGAAFDSVASEWANKLHAYYYALYTESPFYFFNFNIRDQLKAAQGYNTDVNNLTTSDSRLYKMLLNDNQSYFFNLTTNAGNGYGELRDFMNMHDLFYYIIPALEEGNAVVDMYDDVFGMYINNDCSLQVTSAGKIKYNGVEYQSLQDSDFKNDCLSKMTDEELYKFWHDYNVWVLFNCYTTWLDAMQDCDYAKPEKITVMGDSWTVTDPLNPLTYFETDDAGNLTRGRYMVFSRSEMLYYGLTSADLTQVEQKIINIQDKVYEESLGLMNYYAMSDENLIQALSMLELFIFNKEFSQSKLIGNSYELYPQSYELKTFTYDAYLRLILSEASGEGIMHEVGEEDGLYTKIIKNTSLFFGIFLVINDFVATYIIPYFKLIIVILIFFVSLLIIIGAAVKLDFNLHTVLVKSLITPLVSYAAICIGMAWIVSLFMSNGATGVTKTSATISLGDPTAAIIVMLVINVVVCVLLFKLMKKCFNDFRTYFKAVFENISATMAGAVGAVAGSLQAGRVSGSSILGRKGSGGSGVASTAKQRGRDNLPTSGKNGIGNSLANGLAAGAGFGLGKEYLSDKAKDILEKNKARDDATRGMNKYDAKAYNKANSVLDKYTDKAKRNEELLKNAKEGSFKEKRLKLAQQYNLARKNRAGEHAENVRKYGKIGAIKHDMKDRMETAQLYGMMAGDRLKPLANKAKSVAGKVNADSIKKAGKFIKSGAAGLAVGRGAGNVVNASRAVGPAFKKGVNTGLGAAKNAARYTAKTVKNAPATAKKAALDAHRAARDSATSLGRQVRRVTSSTMSSVGNGIQKGVDSGKNIVRNNVKGAQKGYKGTKK